MSGFNVFDPIIIEGDHDDFINHHVQAVHGDRTPSGGIHESITEYLWQGFWMSREQVIPEIREAVLKCLIRAETSELAEKYGERLWMDIEQVEVEAIFRKKYENTLRLNRLTMRNVHRLRTREVVVVDN